MGRSDEGILEAEVEKRREYFCVFVSQLAVCYYSSCVPVGLMREKLMGK